jgi:hypothetical protein
MILIYIILIIIIIIIFSNKKKEGNDNITASEKIDNLASMYNKDKIMSKYLLLTGNNMQIGPSNAHDWGKDKKENISVLNENKNMLLWAPGKTSIVAKNGLDISKEWGGNGNLNVGGKLTTHDGANLMGTIDSKYKLKVNQFQYTPDCEWKYIDSMTPCDGSTTKGSGWGGWTFADCGDGRYVSAIARTHTCSGDVSTTKFGVRCCKIGN